MNTKSIPHKPTMTEAEIEAELGPPSAERDCEIQGWTGEKARAFKEGWSLGYQAGFNAGVEDCRPY